VTVVNVGGCCAGGGGVLGVSFSFVIFFSAGGAPNAGWSRYGKMRRRSASRSVCLKTVLQLTWQADGLMVYTRYCLKHTVTTMLLQQEFKQLCELPFTARAVCWTAAAHFCTRQAYKPTSFLGLRGDCTDFTLRRRQPCRLATPRGTRATLPPETADGWVNFTSIDGMMTANELTFSTHDLDAVVPKWLVSCGSQVSPRTSHIAYRIGNRG